MTKKKLYLISLSVVTIIAAVLIFFIIYGIRISTAASDEVAAQTVALNENSAELEEKEKEISDELNSISADLSTKETINQYYLEYKKTHDSLSQEIEDLKVQEEELDSSIEQKRQSLSEPSAIDEETKGKVYSLKANETYSCPDKIPAGRYIATGSGSLIIYASDGKTRVSENLDVAYNNSYTFDLSSSEKIKVSEDVTLTELKQNQE